MGYFAAPKGGTGANPDCGNATISVAFFFIFAFACNFVILPTFVASIINSYFQANLRKLSLISEKQLVLYRDVWKDLMESDATLKVSDPAQDKFDNLIMQLEIRGCILGFSPDDKQKYNMAKAIIKNEQRLEYKTTAITLFSIREKCRPVTIVDILRRQRAVDLIVSRGKNQLPKQKKIPEGKLHASVGIPEPSKMDKSKSVLQNNAIFSYNIFVILEQLTRIEGDSLSQRECAILKKLVEDNDEDLFTYFEEYVETAGEQFDRPHRWRAMLDFAARAKIVVSQSEYVKNNDGEDKPAKGAEGDGNEGEGEEEDAAAWPKKDEEDEPEEEAKDDEEALEEDLETAQFVTKSRASQQPYGQHVRLDGDTVLDLRGWRGCDSCGEPVNETWDQCPNCKTELAGAKQ